MQKGQKVMAEGLNQRPVQCRLVEGRNQIAIVCGETEWFLKKKENRNPVCTERYPQPGRALEEALF